MPNSETTSLSEDDQTCNTPTHTTASNHTFGPDFSNNVSGADAVGPPYEGGTFIIRDIQTKLVITLREGNLSLVPRDTENNHAGHWRCEAGTLNWLGFRNVASGTYIGYNIHGNIIAEARNHAWWECFSVRPHPDGGYRLLVLYWFENRPIQIGGDEGTRLLLGTKEEGGTSWEFVRVESDF